MKSLFFASLTLVLTYSVSALAHPGGLDASGCHNDRKRGGYHCHRGSPMPSPSPPQRAVPTVPQSLYAPPQPDTSYKWVLMVLVFDEDVAQRQPKEVLHKVYVSIADCIADGRNFRSFYTLTERQSFFPMCIDRDWFSQSGWRSERIGSD